MRLMWRIGWGFGLAELLACWLCDVINLFPSYPVLRVCLEILSSDLRIREDSSKTNETDEGKNVKYVKMYTVQIANLSSSYINFNENG